MGSPSAVITLGYGSWSSVNEVVTLGFGSSVITSTLVGQWSSVITLHSNQPTITLTGQEWITLGSNQGTVRIDLP